MLERVLLAKFVCASWHRHPCSSPSRPTRTVYSVCVVGTRSTPWRAAPRPLAGRSAAFPHTYYVWMYSPFFQPGARLGSGAHLLHHLVRCSALPHAIFHPNGVENRTQLVQLYIDPSISVHLPISGACTAPSAAESGWLSLTASAGQSEIQAEVWAAPRLQDTTHDAMQFRDAWIPHTQTQSSKARCVTVYWPW